MTNTDAEESTGKAKFLKRLIRWLCVISIGLTLASVFAPMIGDILKRRALNTFQEPLEVLGAKAWLGSQGYEISPRDAEAVSDETIVNWMPYLRESSVVSLNLRGTMISNNALAKMKEIPNIQTLDISNTSVDHVGLKALRNCSGIRFLAIDSRALNKKAVEVLGDFEDLRRVICRGPLPRNAAIDELGSIKTLRYLEFVEETPSDGTLARIGRENPDLNIVVTDGTHFQR